MRSLYPSSYVSRHSISEAQQTHTHTHTDTYFFGACVAALSAYAFAAHIRFLCRAACVFNPVTLSDDTINHLVLME